MWGSRAGPRLRPVWVEARDSEAKLVSTRRNLGPWVHLCDVRLRWIPDYMALRRATPPTSGDIRHSEAPHRHKGEIVLTSPYGTVSEPRGTPPGLWVVIPATSAGTGVAVRPRATTDARQWVQWFLDPHVEVRRIAN
jgi:hypothetical protein